MKHFFSFVVTQQFHSISPMTSVAEHSRDSVMALALSWHWIARGDSSATPAAAIGGVGAAPIDALADRPPLVPVSRELLDNLACLSSFGSSSQHGRRLA